MFIPLRTTRPPRHTPVITQGLIALNVLIAGGFLLADRFGGGVSATTELAGALVRGEGFDAIDLILYQFRHDPNSLLHVIFNMLFLWIFGSAVEDRLGRIGFLAFYLVGGVVAGLAHMATSPAPVVGASGSVAAVTGAFLALYPRAHIQTFVFFFIIGVFNVPAMIFVGAFVAIDLISAIKGGGQVAYIAHLAGYAYGFVLAAGLLWMKVLPRNDFDVSYLLKQARRRAEYRRAIARGPGGPVRPEPANRGRGRGPDRAEARVAAPRPSRELDADLAEEAKARAEISDLHGRGDLDGAAGAYSVLLGERPGTTLPHAMQLEVANHLNVGGQHAAAAAAYEVLLERYPHRAGHADVRLLLSALLIRRLQRPADAIPHLDAVIAASREPGHTALAEQLRDEADGGTGA
ncbi:MAG: rhomboid family intramembrane serine protease [Phycisphaerales bacterium]